MLAFSRLNPAERVIYSFMLAHLPCLQACFSGDQVHASTLQTWIRDKTIFVTYGHYSMFSFSVSQIFPSVHSSVQLAVCCLRQLCGQTCPSTSGQPSKQDQPAAAAARRRPSLPHSFSTPCPLPQTWSSRIQFPASHSPLCSDRSSLMKSTCRTPPLNIQ